MYRLLSLGFIPVLISCNIYEPLAKKSTPEEYLESGQACLHKNDYACAIENYNSLPDGSLKNENLCTVYLAKGGVTLKSLISIIPNGSATMLGALANTLIPWSATRGADLASAKTYCTNYAADTSTGDKGVLLKTLGNLGDCAARMAKTASTLSVAEGDACNTPNTTNTGVLRAQDMGPASGSLSAGPGMCTEDVVECVKDVSAISGPSLTGSGFTDISTAFSAIPSDLRNNPQATAAVADAARNSLRTVIP